VSSSQPAVSLCDLNVPPHKPRVAKLVVFTQPFIHNFSCSISRQCLFIILLPPPKRGATNTQHHSHVVPCIYYFKAHFCGQSRLSLFVCLFRFSFGRIFALCSRSALCGWSCFWPANDHGAANNDIVEPVARRLYSFWLDKY